MSSYIYFFTLFGCFPFIHGYYCYGNEAISKEDGCRFFAAIIDAGSTGTRLHLYRYIHNKDPHGIPIKVENEVFEETKPGLSSYNDNPKGAAESVKNLLEIAHRSVPHYMWEYTPITLKATAGLRLLPGDMAEDILTEVEDTLLNSGFYVIPNSVEIMSGSDEGVYSWFTLNLLLHRLYSNDPQSPSKPKASDSVAAFDLGGGSTQLTFWPTTERIFSEYSGYDRVVEFFTTKIKLFTHSFLGNGLVAARLNVLLQISGAISEDLEDSDQLVSTCIPQDYRIDNWDYSLRFWNISGHEDYSFDSCYKAVKMFVSHSEVMKLKDLKGKLIYLFSYFFDRGHNAGLVKDNTGGEIKLLAIKQAAQIACRRTSDELVGPHWMPWQCQDLTYIYSLLHDGYGFDDDQPLFLAKKIKGMEVAWAQGLSYAVVDEFHRIKNYDDNPRQNGTTVVDQLWQYVYRGTNNILTLFNLIPYLGS